MARILQTLSTIIVFRIFSLCSLHFGCPNGSIKCREWRDHLEFIHGKNECVKSSIESNLKSLPSDLFRPLLDLLRVSLMSLY